MESFPETKTSERRFSGGKKLMASFKKNCAPRFEEHDSVRGLPDFSWYNIPKRGQNYQNTKKI
jgi:hypothetical protein